MLKNYFKIAWRNLVKDRQFTILNVLGLSVGLACTLLIGLWVADELNMEKYNANDARLYQVMTNHPSEGGIRTGSYTPGILAKAMKADLPEVEEASEVLPASWFEGGGGLVSFADKKLKATPQYIDSNYFKIFSSPLLQGDGRSLFTDKQGVFVTETFAQRVFGTTEGLIGRTVKYDAYEFTGNFTIRGIVKPNPKNATEQFDLLFNYAVALERRSGLNEWGNSDPHTFLLLKPGTDATAFSAKIKNYIQDKYDKKYFATLFLARFSDRYLHDHYENGAPSGGRIVYVRLFSIIAAFILIIACINFMNLSTARATQRAREVGIKKVVGAGRRTLILQYLGESLLLSFVSLGLALLLVGLLLPFFNSLTGKQLVLNFAPSLAVTVLGMTLFTGIFAGSYPAFYLSAFRPVAVLKGTIRTSWGELWARKGLVVFQFTLSVVFIAGVLIVYRQLAYIQSRNLGYNRDHLIHFEMPVERDSVKLAAAVSFVKELGNLPGVASASTMAHDLMGNHGEIGGLTWPGKDPNLVIDFANIEVGYNFLETVGIKLVAGRYNSQTPNSEHEIIFNETAIKMMGIKDPIGKEIRFWDERRVIVGIAKDFNFESMYQKVKPAFFRVYPFGNSILLRLKAGSETATIAAVRKAFAKFNPGLAMDYRFMDEDYQRLYASEIRVGALSRWFAGLAILISCLGLFGLAAFTAQKRKKEIGIRKVIGASTGQMAFLLSREFLMLVGVAIGIAFPPVWFGMHRWLSEFAYHIPVQADVFLLTAAAAMVITLLTVSFQSVRAATANPVESLRTE